jgi:hypothetical protein
MSSSTSSPPYKISSISTNQFKSCTHHRILNVRHFGMVEGTGLNSKESRSCSMSSSPYKISSKSMNRIKSSTYLRSLKVRHFGMVEATGLIVSSRSNIQCHQPHTKCHPNPPVCSKVAPLRSFNVRHFEMVEATGFTSMEPRSSSMSSPPYKIYSKSTERFKSY